jgi:hypothetical protein
MGGMLDLACEIALLRPAPGVPRSEQVLAIVHVCAVV